MGDENHIRTLGDYSKPSHEGYKNTIELPVRNNVVPLRSYTIRLEQNECSFHGLCQSNLKGLVSNFMESQDARLSKFEANFKQQQSEMTKKIDTVLKAIKDRMAGALLGDTTSTLVVRSYYVSDLSSCASSELTFLAGSELKLASYRGHENNARGAGAAGYEGAQNIVRNANPNQARQIKYYNFNGMGYIPQNCTQPKQPHNSEYFKDKMLLMQAQENMVTLDEEQLLFIAGRQDNVVDEDVDEKPVQDLTLNVDNVFQADDCDAFDSDVDEAPTVQTICLILSDLEF
uniref:Retrovirus-related Pol polyprotein from transposon TNT 1-94 n=1 Tax=Tanacetum cinerariifolium TaxID=118510 RepID=A0A6L2MTY6_TANCI|nr:retrovirus-related Pol polyprotein from transposon TNT 1-94 [Tanacetum cinerariifolium]